MAYHKNYFFDKLDYSTHSCINRLLKFNPENALMRDNLSQWFPVTQHENVFIKQQYNDHQGNISSIVAITEIQYIILGILP